MKLLVIDVQSAICTPALYAYPTFTAHLQTLLCEARKTGTEVIYIRHDDGAGTAMTRGTEGFEIAAPFAPQQGERIFDKTVNSPFRSTGLLEYLRESGEDTLILTGLQTEYCLDAAVKCGFEHGFRILVPSYANTTFDNEHLTAEQTYHYYNDFIWKGRYATCLPIAETVMRMQR